MALIGIVFAKIVCLEYPRFGLDGFFSILPGKSKYLDTTMVLTSFASLMMLSPFSYIILTPGPDFPSMALVRALD